MHYIGKMERIDKLKIENKTFETKKKIRCINCNKIKDILPAKVMPFAKSGAYIPISQDFKHHNVYVIIMEKSK